MKIYRTQFNYSKGTVERLFIDGVQVRISFTPKSGELCLGTLQNGRWITSQSFTMKLNGKVLRQEFVCHSTKVEVVVDLWPADSSAVVVISR